MYRISICRQKSIYIIQPQKYNKMKRNRKFQPLSDAVKAMRKGNRESEFELLGPGFHSKHAIHKSEKNYTRKQKHKMAYI